MPAHSLAGGKGRPGNPRDPSGSIMKCHGCGSLDHLVAQCPTGKGKGKGKKSKGRSYWEEGEGWEDDSIGQYEFGFSQ